MMACHNLCRTFLNELFEVSVCLYIYMIFMEQRAFRAFFLDDSFHDKVQYFTAGLANQHEQDLSFTGGPDKSHVGDT